MAGWIACGAFWAILFAYSDDSATYEIALVAKVTLAMGVGFLVIMVAANACYLLGVAAELVFKPVDLETFRGRAWDLGYWGSLALPFLLPLITLVLTVVYAVRLTGLGLRAHSQTRQPSSSDDGAVDQRRRVMRPAAAPESSLPTCG